MRTRARVASASHKSHAVVPAKQATREKRGEPLAEPLADADADASEVASSVSSSASVSSASAQGVTPRGFVGNRPGGRGSSSPSTPQGRSAARAAGAFRSSTPFFSREAAVSEALVRPLVSSAPSARSREATTASDLIRGGAWFAPIGCDSWISSKGVSSTSSRASVRRHARIRPSAPAETTAFSDSRTASARALGVFARRVPDARRGAGVGVARAAAHQALQRALIEVEQREAAVVLAHQKVPAGQKRRRVRREGRRAVEAQRPPAPPPGAVQTPQLDVLGAEGDELERARGGRTLLFAIRIVPRAPRGRRDGRRRPERRLAGGERRARRRRFRRGFRDFREEPPVRVKRRAPHRGHGGLHAGHGHERWGSIPSRVSFPVPQEHGVLVVAAHGEQVRAVGRERDTGERAAETERLDDARQLLQVAVGPASRGGPHARHRVVSVLPGGEGLTVGVRGDRTHHARVPPEEPLRVHPRVVHHAQRADVVRERAGIGLQETVSQVAATGEAVREVRLESERRDGGGPRGDGAPGGEPVARRLHAPAALRVRDLPHEPRVVGILEGALLYVLQAEHAPALQDERLDEDVVRHVPARIVPDFREHSLDLRVR